MTDFDQFKVTITFNVYLACRSDIDIIYRRNTPSDGLNIVTFPTITSDDSSTIIDTSDKSPSNCTNPNVLKYQHTDEFYTQPFEIIHTSFSIDSTYSAEAVAIGQFTITCHPITRNPTFQPSTTPTKATTTPSKMPSMIPSIEPSTEPTKQPTKQPTSTPTDIPTLQPSISPTLIPTFSPSKSPTTAAPSYTPTVAPTNGPTITTESPTSTPTSTPTHVPSISPV